MNIHLIPPAAPDDKDSQGLWTYGNQQISGSAFWWLRDTPIDWYGPKIEDELLLRLMDWRPENGNRD